MERTPVSEVRHHDGEQIQVAGWVHTVRNQGGIKFLILRDLSGIIQCIVVKNDNPDAAAIIDSLKMESVVEIIGFAKEEKQAPSGIEIAVETIRVLSHAHPELPIPVVEKGDEEADLQKRLDFRWIDLRKTEKALIFKAWTLMEQAFREYCVQHGYIEIHSPKLMGAPSESGAELFEVILSGNL